MPEMAEIRAWLGELPGGSWLLAATGFVAFVRVAVKALAISVRDLRDLWNSVATPEKRRRAAVRRATAAYIRGRLGDLKDAQTWVDRQYTELEAEIEAEGRRFWGWLFYRRARLRRERSLSAALHDSSEPRILLIGDPGSGKSVALRRIAYRSADAAARARFRRRPIPFYVNLRTLRSDGRTVDASLIRDHVLAEVNPKTNNDLRRFLDEQFDEGVLRGEWLFLFDSFDEIPDILRATDTDAVVREYSEAIAEFLSPFNRCRAVVASREFRAPQALPWPRFRVLPLTEERRRDLIDRSVPDATLRERIKGNLQRASAEIERVSTNPLFLRLLCEHVEREGDFPVQLHTVLQRFVQTRLERDRERIWQAYGVPVAALHPAAEEVAVQMLLHGLGLEVERDLLVARMANAPLEAPLDACLDALALTGLARIDRSGPRPLFSFAHRRFQEYFATRYVMRNTQTVSVEELFTDGRWRETTVVLLQTSSREQLAHLLRGLEAVAETHLRVPLPPEEPKAASAYRFAWPPAALHVLSLLQDGLAGRVTLLPRFLRSDIGTLLTIAARYGSILDRKWAIEVGGVAPHHVLQSLLRGAFTSKSQVLANAAYQQLGRLGSLPPDLEKPIRDALLTAFGARTLRRERETTAAFLARLPRPENLQHAHGFLLALARIDPVLHAFGFLVLITQPLYGENYIVARAVLIATILLVGSWLTLPNVVSRPGAFPFADVVGLAFRVLAIGIFIVFGSVKPIAWIVAIGLAWSLFAIGAVRAGWFLNPWLWPLAFFWRLAPLTKGIAEARRMLYRIFMPAHLSVRGGSLRRRQERAARARWARRIRTILIAAGVVLLLYGLEFINSLRPASSAGETGESREIPWIVILIALSTAAVVTALVAVADLWRMWWIVRAIRPPRTTAHLVRDLRAVSFDDIRILIARAYRRRNALPPTAATFQELIALCARVERQGLVEQPTAATSILDRLRSAIQHARYSTTPALLDELVLLAEGMRVRLSVR